jgi:hypothetical protein
MPSARHCATPSAARRKVKHRDTVEAIIGAVPGSLRRPEVLVVGRYRGNELDIVGRTVKLNDEQSTGLGKLLRPAGSGHPWPDEISTAPGAKAPRPRSSGSNPNWSWKSPPTRRCKPAATGIRCAWFGTGPTSHRATSSLCRLSDHLSAWPLLSALSCCSASWRRCGRCLPAPTTLGEATG